MTAERVLGPPVRIPEPPPMPAAGTRRVWLASAAVFLIALGVRLGYSQPDGHFDEFYHALAAQSLVQDGDLQIASGNPYVRSVLFTYAVAASYELFGTSLEAARAPSVLAGALLAALVFWWVSRVVGRRAGAWAALLVCFSGLEIHHSLMARMYMAQSLFVLAAAALAYELRTPGISRWRAAGLCAVWLPVAVLALHMQVSSAVPLAVMLGWAAAEVGWRELRERSARLRSYVLLGALGLVALVLAAGWPLIAEVIALHRSADLWSEPHRNNVLYYHALLKQWQPLLWPAFPMIAVVALRAAWRPTLFCIAIFAAGFVAHSTAAWKAERYVVHMLPFFFVPCGIALAAGFDWLQQQVRELLADAGADHWLAPRFTAAAAAGYAALAIAGALYLSPDFHETQHLLQGKAVSPISNPRWAEAAEALAPLAASSGVLVSSANVKAYYYFHRIDAAINASQLGSSPQFSLDPALGNPIISSVDALRELVAKQDSGLIVIETGHWRDRRFVPPDVAQYIESNLERVPVPDEKEVLAFRWHAR